MSDEQRIQKEIALAGTPEAVWQAIATGPGLRCWFGPLDVEPHEGGLVTVTIGEFVDETAVVKTWDPPHHFATTADGHEFDYSIEPCENGTLLRLVHKGFFGEEPELHMQIASSGWDTYLHTLAQYLKYFPGRPAVYVAAEGPRSSAGDLAWQILRQALGLSDTAKLGDTVALSPEGLAGGLPTETSATNAATSTEGIIEGIIDYDHPDCLGIRSSNALYRFHNRGALGMSIGVGHHIYADGMDRMAAVHAWQTWLEAVFLPFS